MSLDLAVMLPTRGMAVYSLFAMRGVMIFGAQTDADFLDNLNPKGAAVHLIRSSTHNLRAMKNCGWGWNNGAKVAGQNQPWRKLVMLAVSWIIRFWLWSCKPTNNVPMLIDVQALLIPNCFAPRIWISSDSSCRLSQRLQWRSGSPVATSVWREQRYGLHRKAPWSFRPDTMIMLMSQLIYCSSLKLFTWWFDTPNLWQVCCSHWCLELQNFCIKKRI